MKGLLLLSCFALLGAAPAAQAQWPYINPKVASKQVAIRSALILPAEIALAKTSLKGSEGGIAEGDQIADTVYTSVAKVLSARGVTVLPNPVEQAKADAERFAISDLQGHYDTVAVQIHKKPAGVKLGRYTLTDNVARFGPAAAADVLVFLRGTGTSPTTMRLVSSMGLSRHFRTEIAFVDAKTGEILVWFQFTRLRDMTDNAEAPFTHAVEAWLHDIPLPTPPAKS